MQNIQVYSNLHQQPMNKRIDKSINPVLADSIDWVVVGGGAYKGALDVIIKSTPELGGALISPQTDVPLPTSFKPLFFGMNRRYEIMTGESVGRDEFDVKWTLPGGLQLNGSNQINWDPAKGGMWQVDPTGSAWVDSGFKIGQLRGPDETMARWSTDGQKIWNIDALRSNDTTFTDLPASCKNIPLIKTSWGQGGHLQIQGEVENCPAFLHLRYFNVQLIISDQPIPLIWF